MERNKYYTPDISEFYVGFEYELYCRDVNPTIKNGSTVWLKSWQTKIFTKSEFERGIGFDRNLDLQDDWIRVKYLDKEDIESLGFKFIKIGWTESSMIFRNNRDCGYEIYFRDDYTLLISKSNGITLFEGVVKNKSELIKLLKMLNINA